MRRWITSRALAALGALVGPAALGALVGPAALAAAVPAAPPTPSPTPSMAGTALCVVTDPRATELSGLVATPSGYVAINDSRDDPSQIRVFYLDQRCRLVRSVGYPTPARDPEDLTQAPDGTLWVSDTGDNIASDSHRTTVALWRVPADGGAPVIYRLRYPDGWHDAEALFFTPSGTPVIVTKEIVGSSGIYEPAAPLQARTTQGVPLKKVGEFMPVATGVPNPLGALGEALVTGAATSPDRRRVALRTYGAAYEWDVPDGDPIKAITTGTPRVTPLPNEPQGESIAYTVDGSAFLTVSDEQGPTTLRRYVPSSRPERSAPAAQPLTTAATTPALARELAKVPRWAMVGLAVTGLALAAVGVVGLVRGRRRDEPPPDRDDEGHRHAATGGRHREAR